MHVTFSNLLHAPKLTENLLFIKHLKKTFQMASTFTGNFSSSGTGVNNNLYYLDISNDYDLNAPQNSSYDLLHKTVTNISEG